MAYITTADGEAIFYVDHVRERPSPHISLSIDRSSAHRIVDVDYQKAEKFAQFAAGYPVLTSFVDASGATFAYISRKTPWRFPLLRNRGVFCSKCDWDGYGVPAGFNATVFNPLLMVKRVPIDQETYPIYDKARCELEYETPTYTVYTDEEFRIFLNVPQPGFPSGIGDNDYDESTWLRYVTIIVRPQGELFTIQGSANNGYFASGLMLGGAAYPVNESINKSVGSKAMTITWHQIPALAVPDKAYNPSAPNLAIDQCLGKVNDRTFNGYPQGTLMLQSAEIIPRKDCRGERIYDITYQIKQFQPRKAPTSIVIGPNGQTNIYAGHNHTFIPKPRLAGVTTPAGNAAQADWYEMLGDADQAILGLHTNFIAKKKGVNPYDYGNFANLFRPATYTQDTDDIGG